MQNIGTNRGAAIKASEERTVDSAMLSADNVKWAKLTKDFPSNDQECNGVSEQSHRKQV